MSRRWGTVLWLLGGAVLLGLVAYLIWPAPRLEGVSELVAAGQYDEAEKRLLAYLRVHPGNDEVRRQLAYFAMERPDPKPDLALRQIRLIRRLDRSWRPALLVVSGKAHDRRYEYRQA